MASSKSYSARVTENSILTNLHRNALQTQFEALTESNLLSDYYIQYASFFKIDNITLGYTFDIAIKDNIITNFASAQNIHTITDYDRLDPEITGGIDNNFYPRPTSVTMGASINF